MKDIANEIIKNSPFAILLPLFAGLLLFRKSPVSNRVLIVHVCLATIVNFVSAYMWHRKQNNLPLLHVYTLTEFLFLSAYYALRWKSNTARIVILVTALLFTAFAVYNSLYLQSIYHMNSYARSLEALILIGFGASGYYLLLTEKGEHSIFSRSFFWINTGYFLYFSVSFFLFTLSNYVRIIEAEIRHTVWAIHALFMIVLYILVAIGLWKRT